MPDERLAKIVDLLTQVLADELERRLAQRPAVDRQMAEEPLLWRVSEAAAALGTAKSKVYELVASGGIPSVRLGSAVRIPVAALRVWIADQTRVAGEWDGRNPQDNRKRL